MAGGRRIHPAASAAGLGSRRPVVRRTPHRLVNLLRRQQHDDPRRRETGRTDRERRRGGALVVGKVENHERIGLAEREMETLQLPTDALSELCDRIAAGRTAGALDALHTVHGVRGLH